MQDWPERERYTAENLLQIIRILRDRENGCPWDKVQTHASIRKNFLEETCEALEAIDADDAVLLRGRQIGVEAGGRLLLLRVRCEYQPHAPGEDEEEQRENHHLLPRLQLLRREFLALHALRLFILFLVCRHN